MRYFNKQIGSNESPLHHPLASLKAMRIPVFPSSINSTNHSVVFEDGSITKSITAANLDASGRYSYFLYRATPGSNCHNVGFYMNGTPLFFY
jgi:hypothetical protein